jgi:hypothetical protein
MQSDMFSCNTNVNGDSAPLISLNECEQIAKDLFDLFRKDKDAPSTNLSLKEYLSNLDETLSDVFFAFKKSLSEHLDIIETQTRNCAKRIVEQALDNPITQDHFKRISGLSFPFLLESMKKDSLLASD